MMSSSNPTADQSAQTEPCEDHPREELCGKHIGDRRVRVQRQQRTAVRKITSAIRRTLSRT